jgi:hypothetical protein
MRLLLILAVLLPLAACAEHPDPTTAAIETADLTGGVCTHEDAPLFTQSGNLIENFDCDDHSFNQISGLVYADNQE